jgi:alpha-tubulin suppressor-like RCC1 family protein
MHSGGAVMSSLPTSSAASIVRLAIIGSISAAIAGCGRLEYTQGPLGDAGPPRDGAPSGDGGIRSDGATCTGACGLTAITTGTFHTCAQRGPSETYCWGNGDDGRLGNGDQLARSVPVRLPTAPGLGYLSAGDRHSCGAAPAGETYCWGWNGAQQLGDGTSMSRSAPVPIPGHVADRIDAGGIHTCSLGLGVVSCWGFNTSGQLGDGTTFGHALPAPVVGLPAGIADLCVGDLHTCARAGTGEVYCWGENDQGQVADGTAIDRALPVEVTAIGAMSGIACGAVHSCAWGPGEVWCWGRNVDGQLGIGSVSAFSDVPLAVVGLDRDVVALAAGGQHTCALLDDETIRCWGANNGGQLGDGTGGRHTMPGPVALGGATAITAGQAHTCALTRTGPAYCWGQNTFGQLGDGSASDRLSPTPVAATTP